LTSSTITGNSAGGGGGLANFFNPATITSSIIAGNTATLGGNEIDLSSGTITANANNLLGHGGETNGEAFRGGFVPGASDINATSDGTNATLGTILDTTLRDNGGLTQTHALVGGSPAIDAGSNPNNSTLDQRGSGFDRARAGTIDIGAFEVQDQAPVLTVASVMINENQTAVTTASATDPDSVDGDADPSFSLSGTDASLFSINSSTGVITFNTAPDFETPSDNGGDNVYDLVVTATDGNNSALTDSQAITVTVDNIVDEAPVISVSSIAVDENQTAVTTATAIDPDSGDAAPVFKLSGADAAFFHIDAATGVITFATAPEFDTPFGGNTDNIYDLTVIAEDGNNASASTSQAITVTVNPLDLSVNTAVDELDGNIRDGDISLRDAIAAVPTGGTITFANSLLNGTIVLGGTELVIDDRGRQ
jgi:hypothetical protein